MSKNIVLIRFSSRGQGNCAAIADRIAEFYATDQVRKYTVDANIVQPCSNCDYECLTPGKTCSNLSAAQRTLMDAVCEADLVYYLIPNYCGYPCANYFVYNEKCVGYYNRDKVLMQKYLSAPKRFIIVSNTEGENFENAVRQQTKADPEILYLKTGKYRKRSTAGDMMESNEAKADLEAFLKRHSFV